MKGGLIPQILERENMSILINPPIELWDRKVMVMVVVVLAHYWVEHGPIIYNIIVSICIVQSVWADTAVESITNGRLDFKFRMNSRTLHFTNDPFRLPLQTYILK